MRARKTEGLRSQQGAGQTWVDDHGGEKSMLENTLGMVPFEEEGDVHVGTD